MGLAVLPKVVFWSWLMPAWRKVGSPSRTAGVKLSTFLLNYSKHVTWYSRCFLASVGDQARPGLEKRLYQFSTSVELISPRYLSRPSDYAVTLPVKPSSLHKHKVLPRCKSYLNPILKVHSRMKWTTLQMSYFSLLMVLRAETVLCLLWLWHCWLGQETSMGPWFLQAGTTGTSQLTLNGPTHPWLNLAGYVAVCLYLHQATS